MHYDVRAHVCVYFLGKLFIVFFFLFFSLFDRVDFFNSAGYQGRVGSESPTRRVAVNFFFFLYYILSYILSLYILIMIHMLGYMQLSQKSWWSTNSFILGYYLKEKIRRLFFTNREKNVPNDDT